MPAELEKMVSAVKRQLAKDHPDWSPEKVEQTAWAIANSKFNKKESVSGEIVVGENVRLNIMCEVAKLEEIKE